MIPDHLRDIINGLAAQTRAGKLDWRPASPLTLQRAAGQQSALLGGLAHAMTLGAEGYAVSFPDITVVLVVLTSTIRLSIVNAAGQEITTGSATSGDGPDFEGMVALLEAVRYKVRHVEESLNVLRGYLNQL